MDEASTTRGARWFSSVRRPADLVERTRWLFCLSVLLSLAVTLPGAVVGQRGPALLMVLIASVTCTVVWVHRYRSREASWVTDAAEAAAVLVFAAGSPVPAVAFGITFAAVWQRAVYGSAGRALACAVAVVTGLIASLALWPVVPGHQGPVAAAPLLGALPTEFLVLFVARHLAASLFGRERAAARQDALSALSLGLLEAPTPEEVYALAWRATDAICGATPGLRALAVSDGGDRLEVMGAAGDFRRVPDHLPPGLHGVGDETHPVTASLQAVLNGAVGSPMVQWIAYPLPELPGASMLLGAPGHISSMALAAVRAVNNQVALAIRNNTVRRDLLAAARTDVLTGLPNRAAFTEALDESAQRGGHVAVLFCDLDDFKVVNDGLGHAAGDELLRQVAWRLRTTVRADDLCARLGGDEFAVLLHAPEPATATEQPEGDDRLRTPSSRESFGKDAEDLARRLVDALVEPVRVHGRVVKVGVSIGLAVVDAAQGTDSVVQQADVAMYAAKAGGKHRIQVFDEALRPSLEEASTAAELRSAVATGQLRVHYQPVVSLLDGRCEAVEALVRWEHPVRGLLGPAAFIDLAERTGAIVDIGTFVLERACSDAATWHVDGQLLTVHVNVSPLQLHDPGFPGVVQQVLRASGLTPGRLVLEVTESAMADGTRERDVLQALHDLGVKVGLDDFGTGYSCLATLRTLPVDILKIDRSFVVAGATAQDRAVLQAIVSLADGLGLHTVAEGVEELSQLELLRTLDVDAAQGYLFQRPVPAAHLQAWLASRPPVGPIPPRARLRAAVDPGDPPQPPAVPWPALTTG
jgi:predicted signal transduction protein with EAL and GGDEF domain